MKKDLTSLEDVDTFIMDNEEVYIPKDLLVLIFGLVRLPRSLPPQITFTLAPSKIVASHCVRVQVLVSRLT